MNFFKTIVLLPVGVYRMSVTTEEPRVPTAFEWQIVKIIADLQQASVHADVTVTDVFRSVLGCNGVESFVSSALQELFSSTVDVLRTGNHRVPLDELRISEITLTKEGRVLLESGKLPSAPHTEEKDVYFDYARNGIVREGKRGIRADYESSDKLPLSLVEGVAAPVDRQRKIEEANLARDSRIRDIEAVPTRNRKYFWRRQPVSFSIEKGQISLDPIMGDAEDATDQYLRSLTPEVARQLFFTVPFSTEGVSLSSVVEAPKESVLSISPASKTTADAVRSVPITVRVDGTALGGFRPTVLDVVLKPDVKDSPLVMELDRSGAFQLVLSGESFGLTQGCVTDLSTVKSSVRMRCYYDGLPLELPVLLEHKLDAVSSSAMTSAINAALSNITSIDRYAVGYLMSTTPADRAKLMNVVRLTEGDDAAIAIDRIIEVLRHRLVVGANASLLSALFAGTSLGTVHEIASEWELLEKLDVSPAEKSPWIARMRKALADIRIQSLEEWSEIVSLKSKMGLRWTLEGQDPIVDFLALPGVTTQVCAMVKQTVVSSGDEAAWSAVWQAVLRNRGVRRMPSDFVRLATLLSLGDEKMFAQMVRHLAEWSDWQKEFPDEERRESFFKGYGLSVPKVEKKDEPPTKVQIVPPQRHESERSKRKRRRK